MATTGTAICLADDAVSAAIPLGFSFSFYDVAYSNCYVSSNGYLSFNTGLGTGCCTGAILPSGTYPNSIFFGQEDLDPNSCIDGDITYYTTGAAGSMIFVLSFVAVPHYPGPEGTFPVSVQVQLHEGTNEVKIVTTEYNGDGGLSTMGLNQNATNADVVTGRNSAAWSAFNECISFMPMVVETYGCTDPAAVNYDPAADIDDGSCFYGYDYATCDYAPMATEGTAVCLADDAVSAAIPIGFDFPFYGVDHSSAYIGSNGFVSFNSGLGSACCTGQILPNAFYPNTIFLGQEDFDPNTCIDGDITYYTTGAPGSQVFVVSFVNVPHYPGPEGTFPVSVQLQLHESTGEIKIVVTEINGDGGAATMGLNLDGTVANWVEGRNSEVWSAFSECHSWMPAAGMDECPSPAGLAADDITGTSANLSWEASLNSEGYHLSVYTTTGDLVMKKKVLGGATNWMVTGLTPGTDYAFHVRSVCVALGDNSPISYNYYFSTPARLGVEETKVTLFPNPNTGQFTLALNGYEIGNVELNISNSTGQIVYSSSINVTCANYTEMIDLGAIAPGMYQVSLAGNSNVVNYSVVITE